LSVASTFIRKARAFSGLPQADIASKRSEFIAPEQVWVHAQRFQPEMGQADGGGGVQGRLNGAETEDLRLARLVVAPRKRKF
jgi:hypothetical protein